MTKIRNVGRRLRQGVLALAFMAAAFPAVAVDPAERLDDPALEAKAREISKELRCLVCQNQSIDDSNAPLARDLRILVRERLTAGDSDEEVIAFVTERYGDYVLLRPPFQANTLVLWLAPAILIVAGGSAIFILARRRRTAAVVAPLTEAEQRRLEALLEDGESRS